MKNSKKTIKCAYCRGKIKEHEVNINGYCSICIDTQLSPYRVMNRKSIETKFDCAKLHSIDFTSPCFTKDILNLKMLSVADRLRVRLAVANSSYRNSENILKYVVKKNGLCRQCYIPIVNVGEGFYDGHCSVCFPKDKK